MRRYSSDYLQIVRDAQGAGSFGHVNSHSFAAGGLRLEIPSWQSVVTKKVGRAPSE
jgi:hypothetical protein